MYGKSSHIIQELREYNVISMSLKISNQRRSYIFIRLFYGIILNRIPYCCHKYEATFADGCCKRNVGKEPMLSLAGFKRLHYSLQWPRNIAIFSKRFSIVHIHFLLQQKNATQFHLKYWNCLMRQNLYNLKSLCVLACRIMCYSIEDIIFNKNPFVFSVCTVQLLNFFPVRLLFALK